MKIVAENHADTLRRNADRTREAPLLDAVCDRLRAAYDADARAVPADLSALARQIRAPEPR